MTKEFSGDDVSLADHDHYADADWTYGRIGIFRTSDDECVAVGPLDNSHVPEPIRGDGTDPEDIPDTEKADEETITQALARLGWVPGEGEWLHIEGGLNTEAGGTRLPVLPADDAERSR